MSNSSYTLKLFILVSLLIPFSDLAKAFAQEGGLNTIAVGNFPFAVAYNLGNGLVYVTNQDSETVSVIDHDNNVVDTKPVGECPRSVAITQAMGIC